MMRYIYFLFHCSLLLAVFSVCAQESPVCDSSAYKFCKSIAVDTATNPYITGVLGNWRSDKSFVFYSQRADHEMAEASNIRVNGTIENFDAFWNFDNGALQAQPDTNKWVWNSEITKFNRKGFEIENKDPLGRFNSGLYGYNLTLPIAVIQNSRNREAGFDGFEDYLFLNQLCDTSCSSNAHFGFREYKDHLDATQKHSGKYSLKVDPNDEVGIVYHVATTAEDAMPSNVTFNTKTNACVTGNVLKDIKINSDIILPDFSPLQGSKMVISAWAKEEQSCTCTTYTKNRIRIVFDGGGTPTYFYPAGNIIEGWQRYEGVFTVPSNAVSIGISLQSTDGSTAVNFDDLRIFPFNANMKSFVYNPVNLRLMAELDENNYSTFYEYDDDGTLIRVKKETEKGIQTIKETRSALIKQ